MAWNMRADPIVGHDCRWCLRPLHHKKIRVYRQVGDESKMNIRDLFGGTEAFYLPACRYSRCADRPGQTGPLCVPSSQLVNLHDTLGRRQNMSSDWGASLWLIWGGRCGVSYTTSVCLWCSAAVHAAHTCTIKGLNEPIWELYMYWTEKPPSVIDIKIFIGRDSLDSVVRPSMYSSAARYRLCDKYEPDW